MFRDMHLTNYKKGAATKNKFAQELLNNAFFGKTKEKNEKRIKLGFFSKKTVRGC